MLLAEIQAFVEVTRQGTLSRAAEVLYVTQPTLTARIKHLETETGAQLFTRGRQGMRLTGAGKAFLPYAQRTLESLEAGQRALADRRRGATGELVIGAAPSVGTYALPVLLKRFMDTHPDVHLNVSSAHSEEILARVVRGELQLGLIRPLRHPEITHTPVYEDALVLVVHPSHPFAAHRGIALAEIGAQSLLLFDRSSSYRDLTRTLVREAGVAPRSIMDLDSIEATKRMVEHGLGVALLPLVAVSHELATGALRRVELDDVAPIRREVVAVRRRDAGEPGGPLADFLRLLPQLPTLLDGIRAPRRRSGG